MIHESDGDEWEMLGYAYKFLAVTEAATPAQRPNPENLTIRTRMMA